MKTIVVEDSRLAREGLVRMLKDFDELSLVGAADQPSAALKLIKEESPDLLFLDIHMPGGSGFDLLDQLDYDPKVIFTTAYSEYAYRSFDYDTIDYLLKPISPERLSAAIKKLNAEPSQSESMDLQAFEIDSKIFIKDGDDCHLVPLRNVRFFESCKNYVRANFDDRKAFIKKALSHIELKLPSSHFFRANRQYVVNLNHISSIDESIGDGYDLTMSNGEKIEISRRNAADLRRILSF